MRIKWIFLGLGFGVGFVAYPWIKGPIVVKEPYPVTEEIIVYRPRPGGGNATKKSTTKRSDEGTKTAYVPPEGRIEIRPKDESKSLAELVEVKIKWYGLTFRPGLQLGLLPTAAGLDFKLAYIGRLSLTTGVLTNFNRLVTPTLGLTYHLDGLSKGWLMNTEAVCGYSPLSLAPVYCGFRLNL